MSTLLNCEVENIIMEYTTFMGLATLFDDYKKACLVSDFYNTFHTCSLSEVMRGPKGKYGHYTYKIKVKDRPYESKPQYLILATVEEDRERND